MYCSFPFQQALILKWSLYLLFISKFSHNFNKISIPADFLGIDKINSMLFLIGFTFLRLRFKRIYRYRKYTFMVGWQDVFFTASMVRSSRSLLAVPVLHLYVKSTRRSTGHAYLGSETMIQLIPSINFPNLITALSVRSFQLTAQERRIQF